NSCKKSPQWHRQHALDKRRINAIRIIVIGGAERVITYDTGQYNNKRNQQLEQAGIQQTLLCFLQILRSQHALYNCLVHAPKIELVDYQPGKQRTEREDRIGIPDHIKLSGTIFENLHHPVSGITVVDLVLGQDRNEQTADKQAVSIDHIRYGDSLQSADDGVGRTDGTYDSHRNPHPFLFTDTQQFRNME